MWILTEDKLCLNLFLYFMHRPGWGLYFLWIRWFICTERQLMQFKRELHFLWTGLTGLFFSFDDSCVSTCIQTNGTTTNGHASAAPVSNISHLVRKKVRGAAVLFLISVKLLGSHVVEPVWCLRGNLRRVRWRRARWRRWNKTTLNQMACRSLALTAWTKPTLVLKVWKLRGQCLLFTQNYSPRTIYN